MWVPASLLFTFSRFSSSWYEAEMIAKRIQGHRPWDAELQIPRGKGHGASLPAPGCCGSPVRCTSASTPMQLPGAAAAALANLQKAAGHCCLGRNINILITIKAISLICNVYQPPVTF